MIKYKNIIRYGAFFAFFAVSVGFSVITNPATTFADDPPASDQSSDITCAIEKMGWILCPIIETSGKVGDQAFNFLAKTFLETEPELISNSSSGTKATWEIARNLANIMFIIAFLIIILSQVTGQGLNNYGVKKMLPRLVIAAIAVNVSYYICQLIVDLTNILGFEIQRFMVNQAAAVSDKAAMPVQTGLIDNQTSGGTLGGIASGVLGLPLVVWFLMPMLFLGIGTVVITCIVIVIILLLRKAFIVLLVVVSPIAFVAYILPNTEKFFQKWGRMFWQLLLVFPIVSLLFGGGQLASAIVLVAGSSSDTYKDAQSNNGGKCIQLPRSTTIDNSGNSSGSGGGVGWRGTTSTSNNSTAKNVAEVKTCAAGSTPFLLGIVATGIAVAPMIAVWAVLKGALSAAGSIGGKISGAVQNAGNRASGRAKKAEDTLRSGAKNYAGQTIATRALEGGFGRRTAGFARRRKLSKELRDSRLKAAQEKFNAGDPGAREISEQQRFYELQGQAAKVTEAKDFNEKLAKEGFPVNAATVGQYEPLISEAMGLQKARAMSEAMKDVEFKMGSESISTLGAAFDQAMKTNNIIEARALQNLLYTKGNEGLKTVRNTVAANSGSSVIDDLKSNIRANHGNLKDSDPAQMAWATSKDNNVSLNTLFYDRSTYSGLNAPQYAGLSKDAQVVAAQHLSEEAKLDLLKDSNAKLLSDVKQEGRAALAAADPRFIPKPSPGSGPNPNP